MPTLVQPSIFGYTHLRMCFGAAVNVGVIYRLLYTDEHYSTYTCITTTVGCVYKYSSYTWKNMCAQSKPSKTADSCFSSHQCHIFMAALWQPRLTYPLQAVYSCGFRTIILIHHKPKLSLPSQKKHRWIYPLPLQQPHLPTLSGELLFSLQTHACTT